MKDPLTHAGKTALPGFGHQVIRALLTDALGVAPDLPKTAGTGCGLRRPLTSTSTVPEQITCLPCREWLRGECLFWADAAARALELSVAEVRPGSPTAEDLRAEERTYRQIRGDPVNEDQAPRQNRDGHQCPPWCEVDHGTPVSSLSHWGTVATIELPGTGRISARAAHLGSAADRPEVSVTAFRHGGRGEVPDLRLSARDAKHLAAIIDMLDDWDEVRGLVAAIRKAAADIADGGQP